MTDASREDPRARVEQRRAWRLALLHSLYEWSDGSPVLVFHDVWSVGEELGIPRDQAWDVAAYLWAEGLAEPCDGQGGISITHEGIKEVEAALSAPEVPTPRFPPARNVIRIERAVNTVIQQGTVGSTQIVERGSAAAVEAAALADEVERSLEHLQVMAAERDDLRGQVDALRAQLAAPRPRLSALRDAAGAIRDVLEAITRSGRAVGEALSLARRARAVLSRLGG